MKLIHQYHVSSTVCARKIKTFQRGTGFDLFQKANIYRARFNCSKWCITPNLQIHKTKLWSLCKIEKYKIGWQDMTFIVC